MSDTTLSGGFPLSLGWGRVLGRLRQFLIGCGAEGSEFDHHGSCGRGGVLLGLGLFWAGKRAGRWR